MRGEPGGLNLEEHAGPLFGLADAGQALQLQLLQQLLLLLLFQRLLLRVGAATRAGAASSAARH